MTKTPRVGLKLKFFCENSIVSPFFEQVTPSRSSGKKEKAWGQISPHPGVLKGPKSAGLNRVNVQLKNIPK